MAYLGRSTAIGAGVALTLALSACGHHSGACGTDDAKALVSKAIKDEIDKQVPDKIKAETPAPPSAPAGQAGPDQALTAQPILPAQTIVPAPLIPHGAIRRLLDAIAITIDDIRTNGSIGGKTACSASLSIRFPVSQLNTADAARREASQNSLSDLADGGEIEAHGDTYVGQINYNVQETDDKSKIFAEVEKFNKLYDLAAEVITGNIVKPAVDQAQQASRTMQAAASAAQTELKSANLNSAKTDLQLAVQTINAVWNSIDPQVRQRLLPLQKAWWKQAVAQCKVDAAGASTEPMVMAATDAECQAKANQDRATWLGQFRTPGEGQPDAQQGQAPTNPGF
jgi:hypothetical protein